MSSANMFYYPKNVGSYGFASDDYTNPHHLSNLFSNKIAASIPPMKGFELSISDNNSLNPSPFPQQQQQRRGGEDEIGEGRGEDINNSLPDLANNNNNYVHFEMTRAIEKSLKEILKSMELPPVPHFVAPNVDDININSEIENFMPFYFKSQKKN